MFYFLTENGFLLSFVAMQDQNDIWRDGDLEFEDENFSPIDKMGNKLDGVYFFNEKKLLRFDELDCYIGIANKEDGVLIHVPMDGDYAPDMSSLGEVEWVSEVGAQNLLDKINSKLCTNFIFDEEKLGRMDYRVNTSYTVIAKNGRETIFSKEFNNKEEANEAFCKKGLELYSKEGLEYYCSGLGIKKEELLKDSLHFFAYYNSAEYHAVLDTTHVSMKRMA
jgi:hypothetical protein